MSLAPLAPWSKPLPVAHLPAVLIEVPQIGRQSRAHARPRRLLKPRRRLKPLFRRLAWCAIAATCLACATSFSSRYLRYSHERAAAYPLPVHDSSPPLAVRNAVFLSLEPSQTPSAQPSGFLIPDDPQEDAANARP